MFNKLITLNPEDMKNIISNKNDKVNNLTYKELVDELKNYIKNRSVKRYMFKNRFYTIYQYEILSLILYGYCVIAPSLTLVAFQECDSSLFKRSTFVYPCVCA